jgi:hypothetical protein
MDIAAIRPFWKAVLAYTDEPGRESPEDGLVDPAGQLPAVWFQQMDEPRPQRNRIHFDVTVAEDEAEARVRAAIEAGGRLVDDSYARSFWVLADAEGNEACVCTWTDRDERDAQLGRARPGWGHSPGQRIQGAVHGRLGDVGEAAVVVTGVGPQPGEGLGQIGARAF